LAFRVPAVLGIVAHGHTAGDPPGYPLLTRGRVVLEIHQVGDVVTPRDQGARERDHTGATSPVDQLVEDPMGVSHRAEQRCDDARRLDEGVR